MPASRKMLRYYPVVAFTKIIENDIAEALYHNKTDDVRY